MVNLFRKFRESRSGSLFARLRADMSANVLAITAACLPPILILVGGGVDMSRAYMAQTALQNACDAGVLAGRRAQAKSGTWGTAEQAKATSMFNFNFNSTSQSANATGTSFTPTDAGGGVVSGTASTTLPTTIMKMFGTNTFALSTTCSAEFQIANIDVMMVLDTTGSMACNPDGSNCNSSSTSKIEGLKSAIRSFYTTIATAVPSGGTTRVRFGFLPYNGTVNLTNLVSGTTPVIPQSYLASAADYQTRLYRYDHPNYTASTSSPVVTYETYGSDISQADCNNYSVNAFPTNGGNPVTTGTRPSNVVTTTYSASAWVPNCGNCQGNSGSGKGNIAKGQCTRKLSTVTTSYTVSSYGLNPTTPYRYTQAALNTATLKAQTATAIATDVSSTSTVPASGYSTGLYDPITLGSLAGTSGVTTSSVTWNGCIEERATVNTLISAGSVPSGATDLDLISAPTSTASTQWKPYVEQLAFNRWQTATLDTNIDYSSEWDRQVSGGYRLCAPAAVNFSTVNTSTPSTVPSWIETYLGTLVANGNTYHDIGMIWGARLAATNGINATMVNAGSLTSVSRHIIFLTDGDMAPNTNIYNSYGIEQIDSRIAPTGSDTATVKSYHNGRFLAACQRARDLGYTVWVIGFGQTLTTEMTSCASSGRAYYASDNSGLQTTFRAIASQVADLRLKS